MVQQAHHKGSERQRPEKGLERRNRAEASEQQRGAAVEQQEEVSLATIADATAGSMAERSNPPILRPTAARRRN